MHSKITDIVEGHKLDHHQILVVISPIQTGFGDVLIVDLPEIKLEINIVKPIRIVNQHVSIGVHNPPKFIIIDVKHAVIDLGLLGRINGLDLEVWIPRV